MAELIKKGLLGLIGALSLASCSKSDILDQVPVQYKAGVEKAIKAAGDNSSKYAA